MYGCVVLLAACSSDRTTIPVVGEPPPASAGGVTLDAASFSLYAAVTRQLTAVVKDANGTALSGRAVAWSSDNTTVATVDQSGIVTARAFGSAKITATSEGSAASATVTVKHDPIVFVHGFASSGQIWTTMIGWFIGDGWPAADMTAWSYDPSLSNVTIAQQLKTKVESVIAATGALKVDLITHSMGGLSSRYYAGALGGSGTIEAWVSLGGPNHGTTTANLCNLQPCLEMRPGSAFLTALNSGDETPGSPRYATWRTPCDEATTPPESVILTGATNTQTACIGHSDLYRDATVYAQVRDWIK